MTTATLFAQLRAPEIADAQRPGGRRCELEATTQTVDALEDAVKLTEQRYADRECVRLGHIVREGMTSAQYHAAEYARTGGIRSMWVARHCARRGG